MLRRLAAVRSRMDPEVLAELQAAHRDYWWLCAAHDNGQTCCVDLLFDEEPYCPPPAGDLGVSDHER